MGDAKRERIILYLRNLMMETAILLRELESPMEKEALPSTWTPVQLLPEELQQHIVSCKLQGDWWHLKAQYVSRDKFAQIAQAVKAINGKYVSAGKDSEFQIPNPKKAS